MQIVGWKNFMNLADREEQIPDKLGLTGKYADGITVAQQKCLRRFGIGYGGLKYKGQASIVIKIAIERSNLHLATPGQMWALSKCGLKNVSGFTFLQAQQKLDEIDPKLH